jgi:hypothetical protein
MPMLEVMVDESAWDPDMLAFQKEFAAAAAKLPAIELRRPFDPQRLINDSLALINAADGPDLAEDGLLPWRRLGLGVRRHA